MALSSNNSGMDEEKVQKKHSNNRLEANAGDQYSLDTFSERNKVDVYTNVDTNGTNIQLDSKAGHIDSATAPLESIKEVVLNFDSVSHWKTHQAQTNERRKFIEQELEKAEEEILLFKVQCKIAEEAKEQALKGLDNTKQQIQQVKLNLEKAQTEERQAKQDSELAQLRLQEVEQGITDMINYNITK